MRSASWKRKTADSQLVSVADACICAYNAGMKSLLDRKRRAIQYTIRAIPPNVDRTLRRRAKSEGKSLNEIVLRALAAAAGLGAAPVKKRDLSDLIGTWVDDPEFDAAIAAQKTIHPDDWK